MTFARSVAPMLQEEGFHLVIGYQGMQRICAANPEGGSLLVHTADTEQGFRIRMHGTPSRSVVDFDGLSLIHFP